MINRTKLIAVSLTVIFTLTLAFPLLGMAATENSVQNPPCYDKIIERIAKEKGISKEEAKAQFEAKLTEIAKKKGITVEELKKQMADGKFRKGHRKPLDEAKLKELAKKKGITVEELKKQLSEGKYWKDYCGRLSKEKAQQ
ncbi:MAG: hypothetical protein ACOX3R_02160 [Desulfitobacteriia bacterium]|jgi:uncharacterized protein YidB (DUF937 family)